MITNCTALRGAHQCCFWHNTIFDRCCETSCDDGDASYDEEESNSAGEDGLRTGHCEEKLSANPYHVSNCLQLA